MDELSKKRNQTMKKVNPRYEIFDLSVLFLIEYVLRIRRNKKVKIIKYIFHRDEE